MSHTTFTPSSSAAPPTGWDGDHVLHSFSPQDHWTVRDACEGVQIFGGTGSGKTSGSGSTLARAFLKSGFGGVVLTAKPDELALWRRYCKATGREADLVELGPSHANQIEVLLYESQRESEGQNTSTTYDMVSLLLTATEGGRKRESREPYWDDAVRQLVTNAVDLVRIAQGTVRFSEVIDVIRSAPQSKAEADTIYMPVEQLRKLPGTPWMVGSKCAILLGAAADRVRDTHAPGAQRHLRDDFLECRTYWLEEFPLLPEKTRAAIVSTFMSKMTGLMRHPFKHLFCTGTSKDDPVAATADVRPEATFRGKVLVLNLPIKMYGETGRIAQILYKTVWQRAAERRRDKARPVFLWADESQYFVTPQDVAFKQTARSARAATVYLTQSIPNYYAMMGEGGGNTSETDSLLGNLQTKIFHANGDPVTNEWAERVFGQRLDKTLSQGTGADGKFSMGAQQAYLPVVPAIEFTKLSKGGPVNRLVVEGFVFQGGRFWKDGNHKDNALKFRFVQSSDEAP